MKNTFDIKQFRAEGERFLDGLLTELTELGIPISNYQADHLCFRVETIGQYQTYKDLLHSEGRLLTAALVNGREIATFLMHQPFCISGQVVELLELPAPKAGADYKLGFEHAEFVLPESFKLFTSRYPHLKFIQAGNRNINPELCLKTKAGQVKFHYLSLARVIEIEKAKIKDIIFDFDGTLIQSRENIYEINRLVFTEALGREVSLAEAKEKFHPEFKKLIAAFKLDCPIKQGQAISMWGDVSERFSYQLFDGVSDFLKRLHQKGFNIHLWTARDEKSARVILAAHGIESLFTTLSFADHVNSKPHAKSLNFDWSLANENSCVVIGDSPTDMVGSKNVGAIAVAALWDPYAEACALISSGAEVFFYDVKELEAWLEA